MSTFFLCTKAIHAAKFIVNLLLPELDGIANAAVSPFLIPLKTFVRIGNGNSKPFVSSLSPLTKNPVKSLFSTALLNFSVAVTCSTVAFTSSTVIFPYKS